MSMLVCKNVRLNSSSCAFFVSSFLYFSFNFFICTYFSQHVCAMSLHFRHHRIFRYLFMLYDLHTYTSHYAPLRSQAIRRLGGQLVKKLSWRQQLLQPLQDLGVQSLAKQGISNSSTGFHWPTCRNTPDNIL